MPCKRIVIFQLVALFLCCYSCSSIEESSYEMQVYQTSQEGDNLKLIKGKRADQKKKRNQKIEVEIQLAEKFQKIIGFGASFTESSAWNLATVPGETRKEVLTKLFSPKEGAGFTLTRTHINSCDYSNGHYTYIEDGDLELASFSINEDKKGFSGNENAQVQGVELVDSTYDLIPMILEAQSIPGADFRIISSAWSPPSWMKAHETGIMTNGSLKPEHYGLWAKYLSKYLSAYKKEGINIWGITPQNEPLHAHDARWDSNGFTPEQGRDFVRDHLGPQLEKDGHLKVGDLDAGVRILIYDHNKSMMNNYVTPTYEDAEASKYAWGTAFHWYASSGLEKEDFYGSELDKLHEAWPEKGMIHTESSIDIDVNDPIGQYWRESTDYAGKFVPFDTYAYDIITDLNHGTQGYVEWCVILSHKGQPNPYDNFNSAPVLINPNTDEVIYTPLYYLLSHFSKFIRPDAIRLGLKGDKVEGLIYTAAQNVDGSIAVVVFNKNKNSYDLSLSLEGQDYEVAIGPRTMQTIHLRSKK